MRSLHFGPWVCTIALALVTLAAGEARAQFDDPDFDGYSSFDELLFGSDGLNNSSQPDGLQL